VADSGRSARFRDIQRERRELMLAPSRPPAKPGADRAHLAGPHARVPAVAVPGLPDSQWGVGYLATMSCASIERPSQRAARPLGVPDAIVMIADSRRRFSTTSSAAPRGGRHRVYGRASPAQHLRLYERTGAADAR